MTTNGIALELSDTEIETRAQEVKRKRAEACMKALEVVLQQHRCTARLDILIAGEFVPLDKVLSFPSRIGIIPD